MRDGRLVAAHLGRRVVVRRRLPDGSATDLLGELVDLDDGGVRVLPDDGPRVEVPWDEVLAAKVVPRPAGAPVVVDRRRRPRAGPRLARARARAARRLAAARRRAASPAGRTRPCPWATPACRCRRRSTGSRSSTAPATCRRGSASRSASTRRPAPTRCRGWTPSSTRAAGAGSTARWCSSPTCAGCPSRPRPPGGDVLDVAAEPDDGWLSLYRYRGGGLPPVAREVLLAAAHQDFLTLRRDGRPVACGRVAVARGWAGVTAMEVDGSVRRQGLGAPGARAPAGPRPRARRPLGVPAGQRRQRRRAGAVRLRRLRRAPRLPLPAGAPAVAAALSGTGHGVQVILSSGM